MTGIVIVTLLLGLSFDPGNSPVHGLAQVVGWTPQQRVPGYGDDSLPPYMVVDATNTVHAFSSRWIGDGEDQLAIVYNTWRLHQGWTQASDILLPPFRQQAWIQEVFLDATGIVHLLFFGGDDVDANMYYSQASLAEARDAQAWSVPVNIGPSAATPRTATLSGDAEGRLIVLYGGNDHGNGLFAVYSDDRGRSWTDPEMFFGTFGSFLSPYDLQAQRDRGDILHAVWNVVDRQGQNVAGYYAKLSVNTREWTTPVEFAESAGQGVANPLITILRGELFLIYNNGIPGEEGAPVIWFLHSVDAGQSWSDPVRSFSQHVGRNGRGSVVIDSNDQLHLFFGQRIPGALGKTDIHGMWHSVWQGQGWSTPTAVVSGPTNLGVSGKLGFDPSEPRAVIVQGNTILVTWRTDPGNDKNGVWYSYKILDAPSLSAAPLPRVPLPENTRVHSPSAEASIIQDGTNPSAPLVSPSGAPDLNTTAFQPSSRTSPLILGIAPTLVLILGVVLAALRRSTTSR